jgi:hypothetical protein
MHLRRTRATRRLYRGRPAAALSLILLALGVGFELSSVSPWSNVGAFVSTVGKAAIAWLIAVRVIASTMGGYLTGRLRLRWATIHSDEVHFRDTANGLLMWAVGLVITVSFLVSASTYVVGGTAKMDAVTEETSSNLLSDVPRGSPDYLVDALFRSANPSQDSSVAAMKTEAKTILANGFLQNDVPPADKIYLGQPVSTRTGLSQIDSKKRVSDLLTQAQDRLDAARKATAHLLLWIFLAFLVGVFCASFAATIGGRQRDYVKLLAAKGGF